MKISSAGFSKNKLLLAFFLTIASSSILGYGSFGQWSIETVDSEGQVGKYNSLALDSNDLPHISYHDSTNLTLKYAYWNGTCWSIEMVGPSYYGLTSLALDTFDRPHISYRYGELRYAYRNNTGWVIDIVDWNGLSPSMALDTSDRPHISYLYQPFEGVSPYLKYAYWNGTYWILETVDPSSLSSTMTTPSIALDSNNRPHISYCEEVGVLKYAYRDNTGWNIEIIEEGGLWVTNHLSSMALDSLDRAHIVYSHAPCLGCNLTLRYAYWNGSGWSIETIDSEGDLRIKSLALDSNDWPHISYYDYINGDLRYAYWNGTSWNIQIVESEGDVGWFNYIALSNDLPHISYWDKTNGDLKYAYLKAIPATIDFDPDTLNLKSKDKWVTVYIELLEGYDVYEIDINTVMLNDVVSAENDTKYGFVSDPDSRIGDYDKDGILDCMVKFDKSKVQEILKVGDEEIKVTGEVAGIPFEGYDLIRVIERGKN